MSFLFLNCICSFGPWATFLLSTLAWRDRDLEFYSTSTFFDQISEINQINKPARYRFPSPARNITRSPLLSRVSSISCAYPNFIAQSSPLDLTALVNMYILDTFTPPHANGALYFLSFFHVRACIYLVRQ